MSIVTSGKSGYRRGSKRALNSEINITPFVDVMLVLLIIFMVTSPMLVTGVKLDLPKVVEPKALSLKDEPLTIDIDKDGQIYIQELPITLNELEKKLIAITNQKFDSKIIIRGDNSSNYGVVMNVIVSIKSAGFDQVSLVNSDKKR